MTSAETGRKLWKDQFDRNLLERMAEKLKEPYPSFDALGFVTQVLAEPFYDLELKDRIYRCAEILKSFLPTSYSRAVSILYRTAPQLGEFENWALTAYVELHGLSHFEKSVEALEKLTPHGTSEFAVRPFMINHTKRMIPVLHRWAVSENEHVRRLAAEAARPRGVWVAHIETFKKEPQPVLELLDILKSDQSLYVRKAVANCLNDISKDHPNLLLETAAKWIGNQDRHTDWIVRRGCRTLLKQGHPKAFRLFGFTNKPRVKVIKFSIDSRRLQIGDAISLSAKVVSESGALQMLALGYRIHFIKADGKVSPKLFFLGEKEIEPSGRLEITTRHSFDDLSTRRHYSGRHLIELVINGQVRKTTTLDLIAR